MNHKNRGTAVIFNNKSFHKRTGLGERNGTDVDSNKMYQLLTRMGFDDIRNKDDASKEEMMDTIGEVSKEDFSNSDCFLCVILTHGEEGVVWAVDDKVAIDELVKPLKGNNCPSLGGKPKIFLVQACRGSGLDEGAEVADAGMMEAEVEEEVIMRRIPAEADFLMAYSVVPGYFAWRNSKNGSWFVQAVYDAFTEKGKTGFEAWEVLDMLTLMTRVSKKVAFNFESNSSNNHFNKRKQMPCITSMLTKDLFFRKK